MRNDSIFIGGFRFELTSVGYPEQYDVFDRCNNRVGYVRFRGGRFLFYIIDDRGVRHDMVRARTHRDGMFRDITERAMWLSICTDCLKSWQDWAPELVDDEGIDLQDISEE